jgi:hypothetical protein
MFHDTKVFSRINHIAPNRTLANHRLLNKRDDKVMKCVSDHHSSSRERPRTITRNVNVDSRFSGRNYNRTGNVLVHIK